jgi:competence CoiA-like predicted nuclease
MTDKQRTELRREMGWLGYAFLWLLGQPLVEHDMPTAGPSFYAPVCYWKVNICYNTWAHVRYAPNAFHRGMQRLAFGVRWYCVV